MNGTTSEALNRCTVSVAWLVRSTVRVMKDMLDRVLKLRNTPQWHGSAPFGASAHLQKDNLHKALDLIGAGDVQYCSPAVALSGGHASCCIGHSISNDLRDWLSCVPNAQTDNTSIRVCLLMLTPPLCNL